VYGFDYANLKVLLGGWNGWMDANATDPIGYPVESKSDSSSADVGRGT
jgi:hypothetical protein